MDGLLEREIERSALHEGCVTVGGGAGRVIVIVGEAGLGSPRCCTRIALIRHGVVRATRDVDAIIAPDPENPGED